MNYKQYINENQALDNFIGSWGITVYHGTNKEFKNFGNNDTFFSTSKDVASSFGDIVIEGKLNTFNFLDLTIKNKNLSTLKKQIFKEEITKSEDVLFKALGDDFVFLRDKIGISEVWYSLLKKRNIRPTVEMERARSFISTIEDPYDRQFIFDNRRTIIDYAKSNNYMGLITIEEASSPKLSFDAVDGFVSFEPNKQFKTKQQLINIWNESL